MRVNPAFRLAFVCLACLLLVPSLGAEPIASQRGFSLDLPEGFEYADGDGKSRFAFVDPLGGMEFDLFVYEPGRFPSAQAVADFVGRQLGSKGESEAFVYEGREAVLFELAFTLDGAARKGYGAAIGPAKGGTKGSAEPAFAILSWTRASDFDSYADFVLSSLDSFAIDRAALRSPGPVSQYLLAFPAPRPESRELVFGGERVSIPWNPEEAAQVADTAAREYRVLEAYAEHEGLWRAAWARFYRTVYREAARRLDPLAAALDPLLPEDPTDAARSLMQWTQGWTYERDLEGIDFVDPLTAAVEGRGDCDSRAMVIAILLERRGIEAILMVSREFSHALAAVDVPGGGQRFPFEGKDWLVAETTAKVGLGMIAQDQLDWGKWLGIRLAR